MGKRYKPNKKTVATIEAVDVESTDQLNTHVSVVKEYLTTQTGLILVLITAIGAILRFYNLSEKSLWLDEASTLAMSNQSLINIWNTGYLDNNPPLFHYLTNVMLVFGQSEFVLRFLPAVFGIVTIVVVYLIGKEFKDENTGLIAAALVAFSPFCLNYAQEAYSYAMVLLVASLMFLFYLKAIKTNERNNWLLFGVCSALAFWTHFYLAIAIIVIYVYTVILIIASNREWIKGFVYAVITTAILSSPIVYMAVYRLTSLTNAPVTYGVLGLPLIGETIYRFAGFNWFIAWIYLALLVVGVGYLFLKDKKMCLFSMLFIIFPIVISVLLSAKMTMNPRYLIFLLPIIFVTIAYSYQFFAKLITDKRLIYVALIGIVVINAIPIQSYYTQLRAEDWRGYSTQLSGLTNNGDIVVVMPGYMSQPFNYYYSNATDKTIETYASSATEIAAALSQKQGSAYFIVTGDINSANPDGDALQWLNRNAKQVGEYAGIYTFRAT
jgi:mannosyltransferase